MILSSTRCSRWLSLPQRSTETCRSGGGKHVRTHRGGTRRQRRSQARAERSDSVDEALARQVGTTLLDGAQKQMREMDVVGDTEIVETRGIAEDIAGTLLRFVQWSGADLVVMGTHGRRGLRRMVIGSVAERFVRHATCPVLLVREPTDAKREAPL